MKSIIHELALASLFAVVIGTVVTAQEEPAAEPETSPPAPAPAVESPAPAVESPPPVVESVPQPAVESPAPQAVETAAPPTPAAAPERPAEVSRPGRSAESPSAESAQRGDRPSRGDSVPDAGRGGNREATAPERAAPDQGSVAQQGRSGRGPDRPSPGGPPQRDDGRRSQLGISIGPGGVQVFRGNPGIGPGFSNPSRNYYDWGRGRGPGSGYGPSWYQNRGWGFSIDTRPQVVVPSGPVIVTQPQPVQPVAPQAPEELPVPTEEELAGMPGVELRGLLLYAVDRLGDQLDGLSTGSGWKSFLAIDELRRTVPPPALAPPPPESGTESPTDAEPLITESARRQLADILKKYDSVRQNSDYRQINQLWGFQTTQAALRELLIPPVQRHRKQLALSVEFLEQELQQFETSSGWARHLKLADAKRIAEVPTKDISETDRKQLQEVVLVFDKVASEPSYRMISDLLGFRLTQYGARSYLAQLRVPAPPAPPAKP